MYFYESTNNGASLGSDCTLYYSLYFRSLRCKTEQSLKDTRVFLSSEPEKNATWGSGFPAARAAVSSRRTKVSLRPRGKRETRHRARFDVPGGVLLNRPSRSRLRARARAGKEPSPRGASLVVDDESIDDERTREEKARPPNRDTRRGRALWKTKSSSSSRVPFRRGVSLSIPSWTRRRPSAW